LEKKKKRRRREKRSGYIEECAVCTFLLMEGTTKPSKSGKWKVQSGDLCRKRRESAIAAVEAQLWVQLGCRIDTNHRGWLHVLGDDLDIV
jgi:hypothetical protein